MKFFLLSLFSVAALAQFPIVRGEQSKAAREHSQWVASSLSAMQAIKVGMTRGQLLTVFTTEGGISSRTWRRYVYRDPDHIHESLADKITKISQPFLEFGIFD